MIARKFTVLRNVLIKNFLTSELSSCIVISMKQWTPEEIRDFRKRLNLYQKDFASQLGVTTRYIIYLEQGVKEPGKTLRLFLDCLEREAEGKGKRERKGG